MSKRKFGIDSDDRMSMLASSMTEAQVEVLQDVHGFQQGGNALHYY
jgi:hypothetical protein